MSKILSLLILFFSFSAFCETEFDKTQELNGVSLKSGKEESVRTFLGSTEKTLSYPMELVKKGITNFTERCNNDYKGKRKFTQEDVDCKYHNENMVETFMVKDINQMHYFKDLSEAYLLGRLGYNRGLFGYYELVTVHEGMNDKNQKTVTISLRMLDDNEVKVFTTPKFSRDSAFEQTRTIFTLTQLSPNQTHLTFHYEAKTDHWLLNKEISVPQVFASMGKSINDLVDSVEMQSSYHKREVASKE